MRFYQRFETESFLYAQNKNLSARLNDTFKEMVLILWKATLLFANQTKLKRLTVQPASLKRGSSWI
jgi:hypothetical protein